MNLSIFIAKRYLFSKKSKNAINVISLISVAVIAVATASLIIIFSVFNGFDNLVQSMLNSYDPDLKITSNQGKTFLNNSNEFKKIKTLSSIEGFVEVLEENVLIKSLDRQKIGILKGVTDNFNKINGIDTLIYEGSYKLADKKIKNSILGAGVAYYLGVSANNVDPVSVWIPNRESSNATNPLEAFSNTTFYCTGIAGVEQDFDESVILSNIDYVRELSSRDSISVSSIEIKIKETKDIELVKKEIQNILGEKFSVKNRFEQHEFVFKIMKTEKWAIFFILLFIIIIASFSITGSLTMLIIEKQKDIICLFNIGANNSLIFRIFLIEGWLISIFGSLLGIFFGSLICFLQQKFGLLEFPNSGNFIISAYPVQLKLSDILISFLSVSSVGLFISIFPVRLMRKKFNLS